ncbi:hypothetical protein BKA83DRAFT_4052165 [Pisolithus microcarpus]|nr:hypothetical protein BKA83DRAFT_4052165 [Pisolithus microcarpus]
MTAAYAFMDYRAQGQTIPFVIVDIATPPSGGLSLFNLYIALSQSRGQLLAENDGLDQLDNGTFHWWQTLGKDESSNSI